jgi:hypothetical protein
LELFIDIQWFMIFKKMIKKYGTTRSIIYKIQDFMILIALNTTLGPKWFVHRMVSYCMLLAMHLAGERAGNGGSCW